MGRRSEGAFRHRRAAHMDLSSPAVGAAGAQSRDGRGHEDRRRVTNVIRTTGLP